MEILSEETELNIKKCKLHSLDVVESASLAYKEMYEERIANNDIKGCLDLFNSGFLTAKPRANKYIPDSINDLKALLSKVCKIEYNGFDLNWIDVSKFTDFSSLFREINNSFYFNCDISEWDVSNVTNMEFMFAGCAYFNQDISKWNVSNVTDMNDMFFLCINFNQDISNWDVSNVTDFRSMFYGCHEFNCPIGKWNISKGEKFNEMLFDCRRFNQDLSKWKGEKFSHMFSAKC